LWLKGPGNPGSRVSGTAAGLHLAIWIFRASAFSSVSVACKAAGSTRSAVATCWPIGAAPYMQVDDEMTSGE